MKVLYGIDGSDCGYAAVRMLGRMLTPEKDSVVFYYSPPEIMSIHSWSSPSKEIAIQATYALAEKVFERAFSFLPKCFAQ